jgi:Transglycosylase SLT domain
MTRRDPRRTHRQDWLHVSAWPAVLGLVVTLMLVVAFGLVPRVVWAQGVPIKDPAHIGTSGDRRGQTEGRKTTAEETRQRYYQKRCTWKDTIEDVVAQRPDNVRKIIGAAEKYGVRKEFALSVAYQESRLSQNCQSPAGAIGVMQLMPGTASQLKVNPWDTDQNIDGGVRYLKQMLLKFDGDERLAAAAYNAGPNRASLAAGRIPDIAETQGYVRNIFGSHIWKWRDALGMSENASLQNGLPLTSSSSGGALQGGSRLDLEAVSASQGALQRFGGSNARSMEDYYRQAGQTTGGADRVKQAYEINTAVGVENGARMNEILFQLNAWTQLLNARAVERNTQLSDTARMLNGPADAATFTGEPRNPVPDSTTRVMIDPATGSLKTLIGDVATGQASLPTTTSASRTTAGIAASSSVPTDAEIATALAALKQQARSASIPTPTDSTGGLR